ncbi:ROK family protein [Actinospica sp.]|uniref:ROK family protein n=1 Tax=Actinospica sp. TaxID=1872142 RepID=UPI002CACB2CE|nr:ROK family protein [Actinospica sp.]HWG25932.1 ROK family protein [Actinospica sp.]
MTPPLSSSIIGPSGNDSANNASRLLTLLHHAGGEATRAELTAELGCGRSAAGYALSDLVNRGLVRVDDRPTARRGDGSGSGPGRPSHHVHVAATSPVALAAHLRVDTLDVAVIELGGRVLRVEREPIEVRPDVASIFLRITRLLRKLGREAGRPIAGIGVSMPSPVRTEDGYALEPRHLEWAGVPTRDLVREGLDEPWPVHVGNDANLAALAEHRHGAGRGAHQLLYLTTEHIGIGGALITEGTVFGGARGYAMEVGHTTADADGPRCSCGSRGCLELVADTRALMRAAYLPDSPVTGIEYRARVLIEAAERGDPAATQAVDHISTLLGSGIAGLINVLDPDRILLGGLLAKLYPLGAARIAAEMAERSFLERAVPVPVLPATLDCAALLGAAELVLDHVLQTLQVPAPAE